VFVVGHRMRAPGAVDYRASPGRRALDSDGAPLRAGARRLRRPSDHGLRSRFRQPSCSRVDSASLMRRTLAADVLECPSSERAQLAGAICTPFWGDPGFCVRARTRSAPSET
jgi:hypothetical protein